MSELFEKILLLSLLPVITMIAGGVIALYYSFNPSWRSGVLHFAAGVVFSVVAVELLPDIVSKHSPVQVVIGFTMGIACMLLIKKATETKDSDILKKSFSLNMLFGIAVDIVIDGILLGIGFSAGIKEGTLLSIALSIELLTLGIALVVYMKEAKLLKKHIMLLLIGMSLLFFISATLGAVLLHKLTDKPMEIVLSFGLSALLFLVTEELLTEAHEEKETVWHTGSFFTGFLLFLILGMSF